MQEPTTEGTPTAGERLPVMEAISGGGSIREAFEKFVTAARASVCCGANADLARKYRGLLEVFATEVDRAWSVGQPMSSAFLLVGLDQTQAKVLKALESFPEQPHRPSFGLGNDNLYSLCLRTPAGISLSLRYHSGNTPRFDLAAEAPEAALQELRQETFHESIRWGAAMLKTPRAS